MITIVTPAKAARCQRRCQTHSRNNCLRLAGKATHHFLILLYKVEQNEEAFNALFCPLILFGCPTSLREEDLRIKPPLMSRNTRM